MPRPSTPGTSVTLDPHPRRNVVQICEIATASKDSAMGKAKVTANGTLSCFLFAPEVQKLTSMHCTGSGALCYNCRRDGEVQYLLLPALPLMQEASRICQKAARTPPYKANASRRAPTAQRNPNVKGVALKNFSRKNFLEYP